MNALFSRLVGVLVLVTLLLLLPATASAQIFAKRADGTDAIIGQTNIVNIDAQRELQYVAVYSYITGNSIKGTVTEVVTTDKKWYDYLIPSLSTGAKAGLEAGMKGKNPNATLGASVNVGLSWDFKPPRPTTTTSTYDLTITDYNDGILNNNGIIHEAEVRGFGQVGENAKDFRYGFLNNNHRITEATIHEYGQLTNNVGAWIGSAFVHFSDDDIRDHKNNVLDKNNLGNVAELINNGTIDNAVVKRGGYLENMDDKSQSAYIQLVGIEGGSLVNTSGGTIGGAIISGGIITNRSGAIINSLATTGGIVDNFDNAIIKEAWVEGGTLNNGFSSINGTGSSRDGGSGNPGLKGSTTPISPGTSPTGIGGTGSITESTIGTITVDRGTVNNGIGGTGGTAHGGHGGLGGEPGDSASGRQGGDGSVGGNGGTGGTGGKGTGYISGVLDINGGIVRNGVGGTGGTAHGGTGGNGGIDYGVNSTSGDPGAGGKGGDGGTGGRGGDGYGYLYGEVNVNSGTLYNGVGGTGGRGGNGGNGGTEGYDGDIIAERYLARNMGLLGNYRESTALGGSSILAVGGDGGAGGTGGRGGDGYGYIEKVNVDGGIVHNGGTGNRGGSGNEGDRGGWHEVLNPYSKQYEYPLYDGQGGSAGLGGVGGMGYGYIKEANVSSGMLYNNSVGYSVGNDNYEFGIGTANISGGTVYNGRGDNGGNGGNGILIIVAPIPGSHGNSGNNGVGSIETATVNDGGTLYNGSGGNGGNGGSGLNLLIGGIRGGDGGDGGNGTGFITTASIYDGGTLHNGFSGVNGSRNTSPSVDYAGAAGAGGIGRGHIETAILNGGTLNNGAANGGRGTIRDLIYISGTYREDGSTTNTINVGQATVAAGNTTGIMRSLQIGNGGTASNLARNINLVNSNNSVTFNHSNSITRSQTISGLGSLTKSGTGTLTLTGASTYSGLTTISGGLINFNNANNFGTGRITLNGGGLQWASGNTTDISARLNALGTSGGIFNTNGNSVTLASAISGSGRLTKTGSGTLTLTGANNNYSGGTTVSAGTLTGNIANNTNLTVNSGATYNGGGAARSVSALNGSGTVRNFSSLTAQSGTFSGVISGSGSLTKSGTSTLTLTGNNDYTGDTRVNAGTLQVGTATATNAAINNASVNSAGRVNNYGSIGSMNLLGGAVGNGGRVNDMTYTSGTYDGTLASRTGSIGNLTLAGDSTGIDWGTVDNLQFADNGSGILSIVAFVDDTQISSASAGMRAANDTLPNITFSGINVQNSVDFANGNLSLNLLGYDAGDDSIASFFNAFGFDTGFFLDTFLGDMFGVNNVSGTEELYSFEVAFGGLDSFWIINDNDFGNDWTFNNDTGFVAWNGATDNPGDNVVPEPATLAIVALGLAGLGLARTRRRR